MIREYWREYALYNILGMNKKNVVRILAHESLMVGVVTIIAGLFVGVMFSKVFEVLLLRMCGYEAVYDLFFSKTAVETVTVSYAVILLILFLFTGAKVIVNKPIELLRSADKGEKEPKANIPAAVLGALILGGAYYIAATIGNAVSALSMFFVAVVMVIVATYLLFVAGSVFICKVLKKNKNYYYKAKHFVPVSGMMFRMKRNGAGLASICILSTMILVMVASTGTLYVGSNDSINSMYPYELSASIMSKDAGEISDDKINTIRTAVTESLNGANIERYEESRCISMLGIRESNSIKLLNVETSEAYSAGKNSAMVVIIPLSDYNRAGDEVTLSKGEALISVSGLSYKQDELNMIDYCLKNVGKTDDRIKYQQIDIVKYYYIVVTDADYEEIGAYFDTYKENIAAFWYRYLYYFDVDASKEQQVSIANDLNAKIGVIADIECRASVSSAFIELYGSLFLLGIFLSIAFMGAGVLIMYYKQLTEGYEDAHGYSIMRKVGMTAEEIKSGVNSQTLITFFSPLVMAGIHLGFSFPMIYNMLMIFGICNVPVLALTFVGCYLLFALLYLFAYRKTVKVYVDIVTLN